MEVQKPSHPHRGGSGSFEVYRDKYRRVAMLGEEELLPPDPELPDPDSEAHKPDVIEGLSLRMTQAMNHYQREGCCCFMCRVTDHFMRDCPYREMFRAWHKEHLNSKGQVHC